MATASQSIEDTSTLTDRQEKILSLLPIIPTILSTAASATIIYLVYASGFKTSYKRILFGLSVADILISITFTLQPFLVPADTSQRVWASGNDATCTLLGTMTQLSLAVLLYNGMLSYYYLLTIRFGVKERMFARKYEPWMHGVAILYPLVTAIIGAGAGFYHEIELGSGCWVTDYPEGCVDDTGECKSPLIAWVFMGIWVLVTLLSIVAINIAIYRHVKLQMSRGRRNSMHANRQTKRINDVATQAFLYVAAFFGTFIWNIILRIMESRSYDAQDESTLFPLLVLQSLLVPSTGIFNLCIYLRPRYLKTRADFFAESRLWAIRRALYGESVPPTGATSEISGVEEAGHRSSFFGKLQAKAATDLLPEAHPASRSNNVAVTSLPTITTITCASEAEHVNETETPSVAPAPLPSIAENQEISSSSCTMKIQTNTTITCPSEVAHVDEAESHASAAVPLPSIAENREISTNTMKIQMPVFGETSFETGQRFQL